MFNSALLPQDYVSAPLPFGPRLSMDCPWARIRAVYHPDDYYDIDAGTAFLGHDWCNRFVEWRLRPYYSVSVETPYQWGADGKFTTHVDVEVSSRKKPLPDGW